MLGGPRQIEFGRVLHQQSHVGLGDSLARGVDVRLEDFFGRDFVVVEEAIGGFHFGASVSCGGNAHVGFVAEFLDDFGEPFVQPFVAKIGTADFVLKRDTHGDLHEKQILILLLTTSPRT